MDLIPENALNILIVEDDATSRIVLQKTLSKSPLSISEIGTADSLAAAFELLRDDCYHVVLLDLNLPDSSGLDTLVKVRKEWPQLAIVVVTGAGEDIGFEAIAIGAQEYLVKGSYDLTTLTKSVRYAVERKQADTELRLAKEKYKTVFENSAVAITVTDENERLVSWNKFAERLLGMTEDDLRNRPIKTLYPPDKWQEIRSSNIRKKGMQHHLETRMIKKDGEIIDVDISLTVQKNIDGRTTGSIAVITDITERKRIEQILDRKQKNLEAIFDAAPVGMLLVDEDMIVKRANEVIRQMVRKEYKQIINRPIGIAIGCANSTGNEKACGRGAPCRQCPFPITIQAVLDSKTSTTPIEILMSLDVDNKRFTPWLSVSAQPVIIDGIEHAVVAVSDVTTRKEAEEKLKETMEIKSQFISTVSHELRTPLAALREGVAIVLEGITGKINEKQKKFLDIAKRNADRLSDLINEVLDFQKLESGRTALDIQSNDVAEVASEVLETMLLYAGKKSVRLSFDLAEDLPQAQFDRNKIIQVLTNLVSNAVKFTPEDGRVSLKIRSDNNELIISVSDTGMGIPKEELPRIFDRFYRVNRPGEQIQGTGLGLAIVSTIVAMHNGRIDIESQVNHGTTFTVYLPLAPAPKNKDLDQTLEEQILTTPATEPQA